ncbi:hypothetical protein ACFVXC_18455 [Streptomyces sp. NPDC058257]|uniref:hypothetical protein n=1 Tax=Streptomyces sp. NPDC058257 TaxID=3346409 RepID=UPI0036EA693A
MTDEGGSSTPCAGAGEAAFVYVRWGWHTLGDLRPRMENAPLFHAVLLPLKDAVAR